jgi:hypothetical protein
MPLPIKKIKAKYLSLALPLFVLDTPLLQAQPLTPKGLKDYNLKKITISGIL